MHEESSQEDLEIKNEYASENPKVASQKSAAKLQGDDDEAEEELEEFEIHELLEKNHEEKEKWQKHLQEVVIAMQKKRDALAEVVDAMHKKNSGLGSAAQEVRVLIMVLGGGMQGPYGAGQMSALGEMGYTSKHINEHDTFLGISAGAATSAFGMAGQKQTLLGTSYFYTVCVNEQFVSFLRLHQIMDVSVVERALREGPTKLDVEAIRKNPARFFVQAYNQTQSAPEFINAKDPSGDMVSAIHASMAVPLVYNKAVAIGDSHYSDGAFDDPMPIVRAIEMFSPTHVLILPNTPFNRIPPGEPSKAAQMLINAIPSTGSFGFIRKVLNNRQALRQSLEAIAENKHVKIGVAWPPEMGLEVFSQDAPKIKAAIKASAQTIFTLFGEEKRHLKLYEEIYGNEQT